MSGDERAVHVPAGADRFGERRSLGISGIAFKVIPADADGLLVLENTFHAPGGPARHLHRAQDEWFYAIAGEFLLEVGDARFRLRPGDSVLAPRGIPYAWAFVGPERGRIPITFAPAGDMEAFFREVSRGGAMPSLDPALWRAHGMGLLAPPLALD